MPISRKHKAGKADTLRCANTRGHLKRRSLCLRIRESRAAIGLAQTTLDHIRPVRRPGIAGRVLGMFYFSPSSKYSRPPQNNKSIAMATGAPHSGASLLLPAGYTICKAICPGKPRKFSSPLPCPVSAGGGVAGGGVPGTFPDGSASPIVISLTPDLADHTRYRRCGGHREAEDIAYRYGGGPSTY